MMLAWEVQIRGGPKQQQRRLNALLKECLQATIDYWHTKNAPRHFKRGARQRYGYEPRKMGAYIKRWPEKRGKPDLVFSGRLMRMILQRLSLSGTRKLARGRMQGPPYLVEAGRRKYVRRALKKRGGTTEYRFLQMPDMGAEIMTVKPDEERDLMAFADKWLTQRLNAIDEAETIRSS